MIMQPSAVPPGSVMYVTRRPDPFIEFCEPCEEVMAGPFSDQEEALRMAPVVRAWTQTIAPYEAAAPFGVLRLGPRRLAALGVPIVARFGRDGNPVHEPAATRFTADWIRKNATERGESLDGRRSTGF